MSPLFLSCGSKNSSSGTSIKDSIEESPSNTEISEPISEESESSTSEAEKLLPPQYGVDIPMIAHKGYHVIEVENTYDAFVEAGKRSFYGIETDIYLTKDSYWICNHDTVVKGMSKSIMDSTYEEIMQVDLSMNPDKVVHVCTFQEYLSVCKKYKKHPYIELKMTPSKQILDNLLYYIDQQEMMDECVFISFGQMVLNMVRELCVTYDYHPGIELLTEGKNYTNAYNDDMSVSSYYLDLTKAIVDDFHDKGLTVSAWTVNDVNSINRLIEMGVDYVTSDIIDCDSKYVNPLS